MTYDVPIERGKVLEFARATQSANPAYTGSEPVVPPTFLTTARLVWEPPEQNPAAQLGLDQSRLLHGEEEYVFHGPLPRAGQTLHVEARLDADWQKEGRRGGLMRFVRLVNEFRDESGKLLVEQRSVVIETAHAPKEDA
jgi:hypothetical protein